MGGVELVVADMSGVLSSVVKKTSLSLLSKTG